MTSPNFGDIDLYSIKIKNAIFDPIREKFHSEIYFETDQVASDVEFTSPSMRIISVNQSDKELNKIDAFVRMEVEFVSWESEFYEFINSIDYYILDELAKKSEFIMGFQMDPDKIQNLFRRTVSAPKRLKDNPTISVYFKSDAKISDVANREIAFSDLNENSEISISLCLREVTFYEDMYKIFYEGTAIHVNKNFCSKDDYLLDSDNDLEYYDNNASLDITENSSE